MRIASKFVAMAGLSLAVGCTSGKSMSSNAASNARIAGAIDLGKVSPDTEFDFVVGVNLRDQHGLNKFIGAQKVTADRLGPVDFGDLFGPTSAEYKRLLTWLAANGLTITRTTSARTTVSVHGTAAAIEHAFGAELHNYTDAQGKFVASAIGLQPSNEVAGSISGTVGGFDGAPNWRSQAVRFAAAPKASDGQPLDAQGLETQYNAVSSGTTPVVANPGQGQTVVILGAGGPPEASDLALYFSSFMPYGLATLPGTYHQVLVGGPNRDTAQEADEEFGENTLDMEMVAAFAPYADIEHVLTATNSPGLFTDGISYILENYTGNHLATAVSVSYGSCERAASGEIPVLNALFAQALAAGQTWFFASGDAGSDTCENGPANLVESVNWPSSSPNVIGVGGTEIDATNTEKPWDGWGGNLNGAAGGGASESIDKPAYQNGVGPGAGDGARDVPDVSALAGLPGVAIFQLGGESAIGGTSAATPMWAGMWAVLAQNKGSAITDSLNSLYALKGAGLRDITTGDNGGPSDQAGNGYQAGPGYDMASGWGVPNLGSLITTWK